MASTFTVTEVAAANLTIGLGTGPLASGSGRQSTMVTNSGNHRRALITAAIKSGAAAPTAALTYDVYLIRYDGTNRDDNAGTTDAAWTQCNAPLIYSMIVTASANTVFVATFSTELLGDLGGSWGIGVMNRSGQTLNASSHQISYRYQDDVVA
jgi:hypothetical protein